MIPEAPPTAFDYPLILKKDWMALVIKPSFLSIFVCKNLIM